MIISEVVLSGPNVKIHENYISRLFSFSFPTREENAGESPVKVRSVSFDGRSTSRSFFLWFSLLRWGPSARHGASGPAGSRSLGFLPQKNFLASKVLLVLKDRKLEERPLREGISR